MKQQRLAILGSTGSIGQQTLDLCRQFPEHFIPEVITANCNAQVLIDQALEFNPNVVVVRQEGAYLKVKEALNNTDIKVFCGDDSIVHSASSSEVDTVVVALVGFAGLQPA